METPVYAQALLEEQLSQSGMQLEDLAGLAATLSDLMDEILELPTSSAVRLAGLNSTIRGYLSGTIVGDVGCKLDDAHGLEALGDMVIAMICSGGLRRQDWLEISWASPGEPVSREGGHLSRRSRCAHA